MDEDLVKERMIRLKIWSEGKLAQPFKILIYPTNLCNLRCVFCNGTYHRKMNKFDYGSELSMNELQDIVSEGLEFGIRQWWIQGAGEPMSVPKKTMKIADMVKNHGVKTEGMMVTNGTLFNKKYIERLVEIGFDRIVFSIDAPDYKTNDYLRGVKDAFNKAIENIKLFKYYKNLNDTKKPEICINAILTSKIWNKIDDFILLSSENGVDKLVINPMRIQGEVKEALENKMNKDLTPTKEQKASLSKRIPKLVKLSKNLGVELEINGIEEGYEPNESGYNKAMNKVNKTSGFISSLCFEPFTTILIGPMGEVGCCCGDDYERSPLNVRDKSLKEIWKSEHLSNIRKKMIQKTPMKGCFSCGSQAMTENLRREIKSSGFRI